MHIEMNDIGSQIKPVISHIKQLVAGSTTTDPDATLITGAVIDRLGFDSAVATVLCSITQTASKKMTHLMHLIHSNTAYTGWNAAQDAWSVFLTLDNTVDLICGEKTASNDEFNHKINLAGAKRYIALRTTADLSNTSTDKAQLAYLVTLGGATNLPTTL